MFSRKEQKERRSDERASAECAAAGATRPARIWRYVGGGTATITVIAVVAGCGGSSRSTPAQPSTDLARAAAAAGCRVKAYPYDNNADRGHVPSGAAVNYKSNPPSFGPHYDSPASDGSYARRGTPATGNLVHALEHGRVEIQFRAGLPGQEVAQLQALFNEQAGQFGPGQYELLFENATGMPAAVAATAWARTLTCSTFNARVLDALRAFRAAYTLQGPELINQPE